jgi:multimeric flavodoxin WrbA
MKVVGVVAGPRKNGNSARLVEEVLAGAREADHETVVFYMSEMQIHPLEADEKGYVYPADGFEDMMPHLENMGTLVLGTPIYYDHISTRAKLFIDRLYYYSGSHGAQYRRLFPRNVKFISVLAYHWNNPYVYDEVVDWLNGRMTHYWNMQIVGSIKAHGTEGNHVSGNRELLKKARDLGTSL